MYREVVVKGKRCGWVCLMYGDAIRVERMCISAV